VAHECRRAGLDAGDRCRWPGLAADRQTGCLDERIVRNRTGTVRRTARALGTSAAARAGDLFRQAQWVHRRCRRTCLLAHAVARSRTGPDPPRPARLRPSRGPALPHARAAARFLPGRRTGTRAGLRLPHRPGRRQHAHRPARGAARHPSRLRRQRARRAPAGRHQGAGSHADRAVPVGATGATDRSDRPRRARAPAARCGARDIARPAAAASTGPSRPLVESCPGASVAGTRAQAQGRSPCPGRTLSGTVCADRCLAAARR
jgi:hypothetical protein